MPSLTLSEILLIAVLSVFTVIAAITDIRFRKIPNKLTLPVFVAGLVYQGIFHGLPGIGDGLAGFGIGFGTLFVLWIIGGGGGGDVKLMGAIGAWLGLNLTIWVLLFSTIFVVLGTFVVLLAGMAKNGVYKTKEKFIASSSGKHAERDSKNRRIMAFALPVALATWLVLAWRVPDWPYRDSHGKTQTNAPLDQDKSESAG